MRFFLFYCLCTLAIGSFTGLTVLAQDDPAKPTDPPASKPAAKADEAATPKAEVPIEKPKTDPKPKADAAPQKPANEPTNETKPDKPVADEKKTDKPESDSKTAAKESPGNQDSKPNAKQTNKPASKPVKPEPPEKKSLPNVGSLKHPLIPGQAWRIHDLKRPRPKAVSPGVIDTSPPADAVVLFDGESLDNWYHIGSEEEIYEAQWKVQDGYFEVEPRTGSLLSLDSFGSCQLHIEWMIPKGTTGTSQGRGNSGIKLMERYEVQILDSVNNRTYADGQAASIYGQYPPLVNAVRPQGEWQSYDIIFEAPTYESGKMKQSPVITLIHNGVLVHHRRVLSGPTGLKGGAQEEVPPAAPIMLQDHGNRIRFRNIWIREL